MCITVTITIIIIVVIVVKPRATQRASVSSQSHASCVQLSTSQAHFGEAHGAVHLAITESPSSRTLALVRTALKAQMPVCIECRHLGRRIRQTCSARTRSGRADNLLEAKGQDRTVRGPHCRDIEASRAANTFAAVPVEHTLQGIS